MSSDLVKRVKPKLLGKRRLELTAFEAEPTVSIVNVWEIDLVGLDGTHHSVQVLERPRMEMKIPVIPSPVAQRVEAAWYFPGRRPPTRVRWRYS